MNNKTTKNSISTIAQGLRRIKRLKGEHAVFTQRAQQSTQWVDDKKPTFEFNQMVENREKTTEELIRLKAAIARANAITTVEFEDKTWTIQELVFLMAELKDQVTFYNGLHLRQEREDVEKVQRWEYNDGEEYFSVDAKDKRKLVKEEIVHHSALSERERVEKVDELRRCIDALNDLLESRNHTTKL